MEVIFIKDLKGQGKKGEIKEVKDGYAMNFLIKNKYAVKKNDENMHTLEINKKHEQEQDLLNRENALKLKEELEKKVLNFKVKTGKDDKVFGSISIKQIKEKLSDYNIDKNMINIISPIASLGYHDVEIILYKDIKALVKVYLTK
ncbi:MAG: 50S ribosomal protein L9 [bacterium]|nr:50S ribosomal protein L9 [bacterium]